MTDHSFHSKEMLLVSILSVFLGGAGTALFMSREGEKLNENIEGAYRNVKKNIDDVLSALEDKLKQKYVDDSEEDLSDGLGENSKRWSENITQTIDEIKKQMQSVDLLKSNDLGKVILFFTLLGAVLGSGTVLMIQDKKKEEEDVLHSIFSRISAARPLLSELRSQLNSCLKPGAEQFLNLSKNGVANDLLDFALVGLKLWEHVKHRNR